MKRLFLGLQVEAPWPNTLPKGRIIPEKTRHLTLDFLGNQDEEKVMAKLPKTVFAIGSSGYFDQCLFLPEGHPNVVAWHGRLFNEDIFYKQEIVEVKEPWLCHCTIARQPFEKQAWIESFQPLPFFISHAHLYESKPGLNYVPLWSNPFVAPFEEFEHTADIAFTIRGKCLKQIFFNAFTALSWQFPLLLQFLQEETFQNLDDIIIALNKCISIADEQVGSPYKAISFHGELLQKSDYLEWEMIVDV